MPKIGDKVIVSGTKVGNPARQGTLIGTVGPLINVRWEDGTVSLFKPGAGSVTFESGTNGGGRAARTSARAKVTSKTKAGKLAPVAKKKPAAAKPAAKKTASVSSKKAAKKKR